VPRRIWLAYHGATGVFVTGEGRLKLENPVRTFEEDKPYAYQESAGKEFPVEASHAEEVGRRRFGFRLGDYDRSKPLILDPVVLMYAGFIGGSGTLRVGNTPPPPSGPAPARRVDPRSGESEGAFAALAGAVLGPHDGEEAELGEVGLTPERLAGHLAFVGLEAMLLENVGGSGPAFGHRQTGPTDLTYL
jgi:hypothetical protein